jgi:hypothetical protein
MEEQMSVEKINEFKTFIQGFIDTNGEGIFSKRIYWKSFPEKIAANAAKGLKIPSVESVMMFLDATIFGSGKEGLALTDWGLRYNDGVDSWQLSWNDFSEKYSIVKIQIDGALGVKGDALLLKSNSVDDFAVNKKISISMAGIDYNILAQILNKTCLIFTGKKTDITDSTIDNTPISEPRAKTQSEPKNETKTAPEELTPAQKAEMERLRKQYKPNPNPDSDFGYDLNKEGNGIIIKRYIGINRNLVIPAAIKGYPVVQIGNGELHTQNYFLPISNERYDYCLSKTLFKLDTLVILPEIKMIPAGAFCGLHLKSIILPEGLIEIGDIAFSGNNFTTVSLPSTVKKVYKGAFGFCRKLTDVSLPDNLDYLSSDAFSSGNLTTINIPANINKFYGFPHCSNLYNLIIPDNIKFRFGSSPTELISFLGCNRLPIATRKRLKELGYNGDF